MTTASAYVLDENARLQVERLPPGEKQALADFFRRQPAQASKLIKDGLLVGRVGARRVLWKRGPGGQPVLLNVVDASYAPHR